MVDEDVDVRRCDGRHRGLERVKVVQDNAAARDLRFASSAATIASTSGDGSNRTGSVAGSPVSCVAAAHAARAARSSRSNVLRAMPITRVGYTALPMDSYKRMYSVSGGIFTHDAVR